MIQYGKNNIGNDLVVFEPVTLGFPSRERIGQDQYPGTTIGSHGLLRSGSVFYCEVCIGDHFQCGHNVLVREHTKIGHNTSIGTATIIEGTCSIGNDVRIQSMVFIPQQSRIGNDVFIGPNTVLTNARYPRNPSEGYPELNGVLIEDRAVIGANVTILPGVTIGTGSAVAAGAIVTRDVPKGVLAMGSPARIHRLPGEMKIPS